MATSSDSKDNKRISSTTYIDAGTSHVCDGGPIEEIDESYLRAPSINPRVHGIRGEDMMESNLCGAFMLSFFGPATSDAISNLGGGGLSTPYVANLATSLACLSGCLLPVFGGRLVNKFGIKWSCMIAAVAMPLAGSAYYMSLYWILSTFSTDVGGLFRAFESGGQAVSYAINSTSGGDHRITFYVNAALLALSVPCMVFLIRLVPDAPASTDVNAGDLTAIDGGLDPDRKQTIPALRFAVFSAVFILG
ncbi:uncharacterized protein LY79DRAFT_675460 [Colletotrichum navitas]|uniref:Uncharacterized protein n=1 Tax=Colletotrichum navitas TaxID=681940 RepID=A0AAD8PIC2_9PEZI|nr:uncharacterized protein LY79DRAFT_675460 [Colletotrichum navitas]KAK1561555.1 hypothetical protein LY79DRAFT_675460 [Colletotrichum navitas]